MSSAIRAALGARHFRGRFPCTRQTELFRFSQAVKNTIPQPRLCSSSVTTESRNPASFFFDENVQKHLMELNLRDTSKVFERRKEGHTLKEPMIKFLTQEQLDQEMDTASATAEHFLQIPPVLPPRKEINEVLSEDPELQGHDESDSKFIFTDISNGVAYHDRLIVARDPDGTLRKASWNERHRMNQIYFPIDGRSMITPKLFETDNIKSLLERSEFQFLLDRACIQFEPDDPDYISVSSLTFEFINEHAKYDDLRGTRHFASMVFYLCFHNKIDNILLHCISKYNIQDAATIIKVYNIINSRLPGMEDQPVNDTDIILRYIDNFAVHKPELRKMLNAYLELNLKEPGTISGSAQGF